MTSFSTILVATDLREGSCDLLRGAGAIAERTKAKLHVLHSFDLSRQSYSDAAEASSFQGRVAEVDQQLKEAVAACVPATVQVSTQTIIYSAHKAITSAAEEIGADLIVLGAHRARPVGNWLGSTADRVVRSASAPCLVLKSPLSLPLRQLLVPTDLSEASEPAIEMAMRIAIALGPSEGTRPAELGVVHVLDRALALDEKFRNDVVLPELRRVVDRACLEVQGSEQLPVREEIVWGDSAVDELQLQMESAAYDLVVLGTHGYGAVTRALLGSVASGVTRVANCPVLLVPPSPGLLGD